MFGWFKKRRPELSPETKALADKILGPQALAVAIAESVRDYATAVRAGRASMPAHKRENPNVEGIWADVRIEAVSRLIGFGRADLMLLADIRRQAELFAAFLDDRPHLRFPQPSGEPIADTLQAMWQAYVYLDAVGSELADRATDRVVLKAKGRDILSDFTSRAMYTRIHWDEFERAVKAGDARLPPLPTMMLDVFWEDVTAKTKSIALSKVFGPNPETGMRFLLDIVAKEGSPEDVASISASLDRVRAAREPDDIREPARKRS